jgi:hypothetical protein
VVLLWVTPRGEKRDGALLSFLAPSVLLLLMLIPVHTGRASREHIVITKQAV